MNKRTLIILIVLMVIGAFFRFYNPNWDNGNSFHPDERNIANAVSRIHFFNQLNPDFFAYGGFSIYLYRAIGEIVVKITNNSAWINDWRYINIISRICSAFFSSITLLPLFFLTRKLFNKEIAILTSFFYIFCVSSIQTAHYGITENSLTFFVVLLSLLSFNLVQNPKFSNYIKCGIVLGISVSTKTTALSFIIMPIITNLLISVQNRKSFFKYSFYFLFFLLITFATFTLFSPYTFISWNKFIESMNYESGVALGTLNVPYTLQFAKTSPYIFQINNFFWQMGPVAFFSLIGAMAVLIKAILKKDSKLVFVLSFPLFYFLYVGSWHTKFIRFMVPILPFLAIYASYILSTIKTKNKLFGHVLIDVVVILTILWSLAFFSIYKTTQTRISASNWIYKNIPAGSIILGEHWDDGLPITTLTHSPTQYNIKQLTIYEPDNKAKIKYYATKLSAADYIVINSRRLYGTLINLPETYPVTSKYYKLLFSEELGYKKLAEFTSYPSIFGIEINDDKSEETFQVYDHPKVIIFKNDKKFSTTHIENLILNE